MVPNRLDQLCISCRQSFFYFILKPPKVIESIWSAIETTVFYYSGPGSLLKQQHYDEQDLNVSPVLA